MSAGGAFGGNRGLSPVPPEKGVFPLDHMHLCDLEKKEYLSCLKTWGHQSEKCRLFSKRYLECRMEKNLMAKQDMSELGFVKGRRRSVRSENRQGAIVNAHKPSRCSTNELGIYGFSTKNHFAYLTPKIDLIGEYIESQMNMGHSELVEWFRVVELPLMIPSSYTWERLDVVKQLIQPESE